MIEVSINENLREQTIEVDGKKFEVKKLVNMISWECLCCKHKNLDEDEYLDENFVCCEDCGEMHGIDLDDKGNIIRIDYRHNYKRVKHW